MEGYLIKYKAFDKGSRVLLNHTLFGRLISKKNKRKKIAYYKKGMLHDVEFKRIKNGQIFVKSLDKIYVEDLRMFGDINITQTKMDIEETEFITGYEYWAKVAKNRNLLMRPCRSRG